MLLSIYLTSLTLFPTVPFSLCPSSFYLLSLSFLLARELDRPESGSIGWKWVNILRSRLALLISCIFGLADTRRDIRDQNNCGFLPFVRLFFAVSPPFLFLCPARCKNAELPRSYRECYRLGVSCTRLLAWMLSDVVHDDVQIDMQRFVCFVIPRMHEHLCATLRDSLYPWIYFLRTLSILCLLFPSLVFESVSRGIYHVTFASSCHVEWTEALAIDKLAYESRGNWRFCQWSFAVILDSLQS